MNNDDFIQGNDKKNFSSKGLIDITNKQSKITKNNINKNDSNSYLNNINNFQKNEKKVANNILNNGVYVKKRSCRDQKPNIFSNEFKDNFECTNKAKEMNFLSNNSIDVKICDINSLEPKIQTTQLLDTKNTLSKSKLPIKNVLNTSNNNESTKSTNSTIFSCLIKDSKTNKTIQESVKGNESISNIKNNDKIEIYNEYSNSITEIPKNKTIHFKETDNHSELNLKQSPDICKDTKESNLVIINDFEHQIDKQCKFTKSKSSKFYNNLIPFDSIHIKSIIKPPISSKNANNTIFKFSTESNIKSDENHIQVLNENDKIISDKKKKSNKKKSKDLDSGERKMQDEVKKMINRMLELPDSYLLNNNLYSDYGFFIKERNLSVQYPYEYLDDIELNLYEEENDYPILYGYMDVQDDIVPKMRALLIDWLIDVTFRYNFNDEVIHLTCFIIDYYLTKIIIKRDSLQLIGACSLLIATKFHEIKPPLINDLVFISDQAYQYDDVIKYEFEILQKINFSINLPCCLSFFQLFSCKLGFDKFKINYGMFLLETALLEYEYLRYKPSVRSLSVCYLLLDTNDDNTMNVYKILESLNNPKIIKECISKFQNIFEYRPDSNVCNFKAVRKKYSSEKYLMVALV